MFYFYFQLNIDMRSGEDSGRHECRRGRKIEESDTEGGRETEGYR